MVLYLAVLVEHRLVTDTTQTDTGPYSYAYNDARRKKNYMHWGALCGELGRQTQI